jgi:hypothetical protein
MAQVLEDKVATSDHTHATGLPEAPPATSRPTGDGRSLSTGMSRLLAIGWPVAIGVSIAVEPTAQQTSVVGELVGTVIAMAFFVVLASTVVAAATKHPSAALRSVGTGFLAVTATVACPLTGHHPQIGAWWYLQMALSVGMLAISFVALRHTAASTAPADASV